MIIYTAIGWNHPSQANWNYGIYQVTYIDPKSEYFHSWTVKESFGGDSRFRQAMQSLGYTTLQVKGVFPSQKCTGIRSMQDMESKEFIQEVDTFIKEKTAYHKKYNH